PGGLASVVARFFKGALAQSSASSRLCIGTLWSRQGNSLASGITRAIGEILPSALRVRQQHSPGKIHGNLSTTGGAPAPRQLETSLRMLQAPRIACSLRVSRKRARRKRLHRDSDWHQHAKLERRFGERAVYFAEQRSGRALSSCPGRLSLCAGSGYFPHRETT